jgi:hypothetical protein
MSTTRDTTTTASQAPAPLTPPQQAKWTKIFWSPNERGQPYYFRNSETGETTWDEPNEEFWLWDYKTGANHVSGLQKPTPRDKRTLYSLPSV